MLSIDATNDKELLDGLSQRIFGKPYNGGAGFVLYSDDKPAGIARITVEDDVAYLQNIGIVPEERGKGYGDFITRALMNNLSQVVRRIVAVSVCNYFLKFGFEQIDGRMEIDSKDIVFPRKCQHNS